MCALLDPVDVEQALGKEPGTVDFHELVRVAESGYHQASLSTITRDVMRQGVDLSRGSVTGQV